MPPSVQSLSRALRLLGTLCDRPQALAPAELSREHDLHISTVVRLLATLEQEGFVVRLASGRYRPSSHLVLMANRWSHLAPGARIVHATLQAIVELTGESAVVAARSGLLRVTVDGVDSPMLLKVSAGGEGDVQPLLEGATGHALLADASDAEIAVLRQKSQARFGANILISKQQSDGIFRQLRSDGSAVFERRYGRVFSAPVAGTDGMIVCAVGVIGPSERWTSARVDQCREGILQAAASLSDDLSAETALSRAKLLAGLGMPLEDAAVAAARVARRV